MVAKTLSIALLLYPTISPRFSYKILAYVSARIRLFSASQMRQPLLFFRYNLRLEDLRKVAEIARLWR